jgi:hypothetical protein
MSKPNNNSFKKQNKTKENAFACIGMFDVCLTFVFFTLRMRFGLAGVPRTIRRSAFAKHWILVV